MGILLIEDEKKVAGLIKKMLEAENFAVDCAFDGEEGYQKALTESYTLIILDLVLPKKNGLSIITDLRKNNIATPILVLSTKSTVEDIVEGLETGADDYMTKPFAFAELLARIQALLRRTGQERGAPVQFAGFLLDPVKHKIWYNDTEMDLTGKEYSLLEYLLRNPNRVISRSEIADEIWANSEKVKYTNIVDVYVSYLRKKIDRDVGMKIIHTVRGSGFIFKEPNQQYQ